MNEDNVKETLVLLAFNNIGDLIRSNHTLKTVNDQLEQFIFVSGHDLQEPLRKIQTFSNYLIDYENTDHYIKQYLNKINETSSRMSALLRDLLSYSALLQNRTRNPVKTELNKTLNDVMVTLDLLIREKDAVINIGALPMIVADPKQMDLLFDNLLRNALKFNRGRPLINVSAQTVSSMHYEKFGFNKDKNYVCIQVNDNGIGFNEKYVSKIFSFFQRLHSKEGIEGTGMGLPIAKKIVEDHGGRIVAEGKEDEGATFSVFLPRA